MSVVDFLIVILPLLFLLFFAIHSKIMIPLPIR